MLKIPVMPRFKIDFVKLKSELVALKKIDKKNLIYFAMSFGMALSKVMGNLTPFGTAFFASVCTAKNLLSVLLGVTAGSIAAHRSSVAICYVVSSAVISFINILWDKPVKSVIKATSTGALLLLTKILYCQYNNLMIYDVILSFAEALLCALTVLAADKAIPVIMKPKKRTCLSTEETVSSMVILSVLLLSFNSLPHVMDIKLGNVLGIAAILLINLKSTVPLGAVIGIVVGTVNSISVYNAGSVIGAYAFSSLISSLFKKFGKTGVVMSFIVANSVITVILNNSSQELISTYEILWASILVFALPKKYTDIFNHFTAISNTDQSIENSKISGIYKQQLSRISESVSVLSKNPKIISSEELIKKEVSSLVNRTAQKTCSDCSLRFCCWQKKAEETKKGILHLLASAKSYGKADIHDVDEQLKNRCIRTENLLRSFNDSYELYRTNIMWQRRLNDVKALSALQMKSISKILQDIATEEQSVADESTIKQIKTALDSIGIVPQSIDAYFKGNGSLIIELTFADDNYREDTKFLAPPCLSQALGVKIRFNEIRNEDNRVILSYSMCERYCRATGAATIQKQGEKVSGDCYTTLNLSNGSFVTAISDGMGSGEAAYRESKNTINLLNNFLGCGFDAMHAIKLTNSSLMMSSDEMFSTIDLCNINLYTGIADFIKIGGASTYIKCGKKVEKLTSSTLPAGILSNIKPKHFSKKLESDSLIIMVSDGIENASANDNWLEKRLASMDSINPHVIADKILELALFNSGGKAKDDMTVVATRIWQGNNV